MSTKTLAVQAEESSLAKVFAYEDKQVRTVEINNGEIWFAASDIATVLEMRDAFNATRELEEDEKGTTKVSTPSGIQSMTVISESGLYTLLVRSNKPEAKPFRRWVTHKVLPEIRKSGSYLSPKAEEEINKLRDEKQALQEQVDQLQDANEALRARNHDMADWIERKSAVMKSELGMVEELAHRPTAPKRVKQLLAKSQFLTVEELALILNAGKAPNAPVIERNSLFVWLRQYGYLSVEQEDWNQPTKASAWNGWWYVRIILLPETGAPYIQPICTIAGLEYLLRLQQRSGETFKPLSYEEIRWLMKEEELAGLEEVRRMGVDVSL